MQSCAEFAPEPTPAQQAARDRFDLEAALALLPPPSAPRPEAVFGNVGQRLRAELRTTTPEPVLRLLARESLGAVRMSSKYLEALRVVLGNQAEAERRGYLVELNVRTSFATERTMRTILDQMKAAGVTFTKTVSLGPGRCQDVQCFGRLRAACSDADAPVELERCYRKTEAGHRVAPPLPPDPSPLGIPEHEVAASLNDTAIRVHLKRKSSFHSAGLLPVCLSLP